MDWELVIMYAIVFLIAAAAYVVYALALMTIARKTKTLPAWLAWIPLANYVLVARAAKAASWSLVPAYASIVLSVVGIFLPQPEGAFVMLAMGLLFLGISTYWWWGVLRASKHSGWWALLVLIPLPFFPNYVLITQFALTCALAWRRTAYAFLILNFAALGVLSFLSMLPSWSILQWLAIVTPFVLLCVLAWTDSTARRASRRTTSR